MRLFITEIIGPTPTMLNKFNSIETKWNDNYRTVKQHLIIIKLLCFERVQLTVCRVCSSNNAKCIIL